VTIEATPAFLRDLKQFEDPRERRPVGQATSLEQQSQCKRLRSIWTLSLRLHADGGMCDRAHAKCAVACRTSGAQSASSSSE
jgi:hypothetical protein